MFSVREFRPADAAAVWRVHECAFRASRLPFEDDPELERDLREPTAHYVDADGTLLVGEIDGEHERSAETVDGDERLVALGASVPVDETTVEFRRLRVDPDHQRRGYASRLLDELRARAVADGFETVALETDERLRAARALYESRGYEQTGDGCGERCGVEYRLRLQGR